MSVDLRQYLLHLADNRLILGQRLAEWCGHGPVLEQDIALTNIALDLIGQSRIFYQLIAQLEDDGSDEDSLALLRKEREYLNHLLVELPNQNFGVTMLRQCFVDAFNLATLEQLGNSTLLELAAIAQKSIKEVAYHFRTSSEWVIRLGDGTEESRDIMLEALDNLWPYTGELFMPATYEIELFTQGIAADLELARNVWMERVNSTLNKATLPVPDANIWMHSGGKTGRHTEHMGYLLTELQYLQRTYPNMTW